MSQVLEERTLVPGQVRPLVPASISIHGYVYDVKTGRLIAVKNASL
jgi:carbonic anhydrase